jgi:hypothetical protein
LLVWYSLLNPDKGSIWFLVGLATRTCVDLGFHNEHNAQVEQLDALELDMRRRLFWCAYKMDRLMSQSLGRPPSIPDGFINVSVRIRVIYSSPTDSLSSHRTCTMLTSIPATTAHSKGNLARTKPSSCTQPSFDSFSPRSSPIPLESTQAKESALGLLRNGSMTVLSG